jgi:hypothetical protein
MKRDALGEEAQLTVSKDPTEHLDREKKVGTRSYPMGVVRRKAATEDNAMDVRVQTPTPTIP